MKTVAPSAHGRGSEDGPDEHTHRYVPTRDWQFQLNNRTHRIILVTVVLLLTATFVYRNWWPFLAGWITYRNKPPAPAVYERAIKYDPDNAEYHFVLAQLYNYSTEHLNVERAGVEYEAAARLNPNRSAHWLELSKFYEQAGDTERARSALQKALENDPNWAQMRWAAANFYVRLNDLKSADLELRRTADLDVSYLNQVLDLVWRFYQDPEKIMSTHLPNTKGANLVALNYFVTQKSETGAAIAWSKLKTFRTTPQERLPYVDFLIMSGKPHQAWEVFGGGTAPEELFFNGSFETQPLNGGFDWLFDSDEVRRDLSVTKSGMASMLIVFDGKQNPDYAGLFHSLPLVKGKQYTLSFWMKTEAISTNEGVFVEMDGQSSEKQVGTTYWRQFTIPFTASSDLGLVRLRRLPSKKIDNLLKGKVWLDDFVVTEVR